MQIDLMQHSDKLGYGRIKTWAAGADVDLRKYRPDLGDKIAQINPAAVDGLIVLGGPQDVEDDASWIAAERIIIRSLGKLQRPVLGIGFGARQIVRAFGAAVAPVADPRLGITRVEDCAASNEFFAYSWTSAGLGELPGAKTLFKTDAGAVAGFAYHDNIVGLQFHPEFSAADLAALAAEKAKVPAGADSGAAVRLSAILQRLFA